MKQRLSTWFHSQRSQGMTEFAIIAPIILLLTFGIIDFGRGLYFYITLQQAANEGARVAVRASYFVDPSGSTHQWPTDADVASAVQQHAVTENLANPCPNGPIPNGGNPVGSASLPPANSGWIFDRLSVSSPSFLYSLNCIYNGSISGDYLTNISRSFSINRVRTPGRNTSLYAANNQC